MRGIWSTPSGLVTLLKEWGHGKGTPGNPRRPASLITDDGDGHYRQWIYTGKLDDALVTLARLENLDGKIAVKEGAGYHVIDAPADFWIEREEDWVPNLAAYPNVIAYEGIDDGEHNDH